MSPIAQSLIKNFSHLGILLQRTGAQNFTVSKIAQYQLTLKISSQSVHNFLRYPAYKLTNEHTYSTIALCSEFLSFVQTVSCLLAYIDH